MCVGTGTGTRANPSGSQNVTINDVDFANNTGQEQARTPRELVLRPTAHFRVNDLMTPSPFPWLFQVEGMGVPVLLGLFRQPGALPAESTPALVAHPILSLVQQRPWSLFVSIR